jgi:hypothetical protein
VAGSMHAMPRTPTTVLALESLIVGFDPAIRLHRP